MLSALLVGRKRVLVDEVLIAHDAVELSFSGKKRVGLALLYLLELLRSQHFAHLVGVQGPLAELGPVPNGAVVPFALLGRSSHK